MNIYKLPVLGKVLRKERVMDLVMDLEELEFQMRDVCAAILELTDQGDDLHKEIVELLRLHGGAAKGNVLQTARIAGIQAA